jgi:hypothetical protein
MAPWKLPLFVAAIVVPIIGGFYVGGGGVGLAMGAVVVLAILLAAIAQRPEESIASAPAADGARHILIVAVAAVEEPDDVARMVRTLGLETASGEEEVRVLVPARLGFLDRWASDVEQARRSAQRQLVATVAALAKAGVVAEARVGDEDIVQAVEDQLQSYPATDVLLVDRGEDGEDKAAAELRTRLEADFQRLQLAE